MIATCTDHLISALADMPAATGGQKKPPRDVLRSRLEALQGVTIRLRPADPYCYRVLALLFRLPDLRPAPRAVLLNYLDSNLDFSPPETGSHSPPEIGETPSPEPPPAADAPSRPRQETPVPAAPGAAPPPSPDAGAFVAPARREDLFDRFLSWVAALVS
jgi:hypothetical protein